MRDELLKSIKHGDLLEMMYMAVDGGISKRRIKVFLVGDVSFRAYCYLRKTNRTFRIDNVLALIPVREKESVVI